MHAGCSTRCCFGKSPVAKNGRAGEESREREMPLSWQPTMFDRWISMRPPTLHFMPPMRHFSTATPSTVTRPPCVTTPGPLQSSMVKSSRRAVPPAEHSTPPPAQRCMCPLLIANLLPVPSTQAPI